MLFKFITFLFLLTFTSNVMAQDIVLPQVPNLQLNEPDVGEAISPLQINQRAPFTGILFSTKAAARITVELRNVPEQIRLEVEKSTKLCFVDCHYKLENLRIERESDNQVSDARISASLAENLVLVDRLKELEKRESNVMWWTAGGVVAGASLSILIIIAGSLAN